MSEVAEVIQLILRLAAGDDPFLLLKVDLLPANAADLAKALPGRDQDAHQHGELLVTGAPAMGGIGMIAVAAVYLGFWFAICLIVGATVRVSATSAAALH